MENFDKFAQFFEGPAGESLLQSQLAMLEAYEKLLDSGSLESSSMNEVIKSALAAQLAMLKAGGGMGDQWRGMQRQWIDEYKAALHAQMAARRSSPAPEPGPDAGDSKD